ncbi:hypothetical protein SKAU_G00191900 [Synaphobranchus kaupii]|uniref:CCHC-type domain-containing protein n=1 Tax=Synaphobranchus kaupii TaxID=118154 RepID=A0A9Q1IWY3_SYNKA|nr:hypothetical protein SKAU_G00191900 [Synaphobranchus kaupii]
MMEDPTHLLSEQCRQWPGVLLSDYQLDLCELYSRWCEQDPGGEDEDDALLRDQFLLGLQDGPLKQELQRQLRLQARLTFRQVSMEACALERELRGEDGLASQVPVTSLATRELPGRPEVDLERWKEEVKQDQLQDQLMALVWMALITELRQQCTPGPVAPLSGGTETWGAVTNHCYAPLTEQHFFPYRLDKRGRPICRECGEVGHVQRRCPVCRRERDLLNPNPRPW